jgi:hypothetical protein
VSWVPSLVPRPLPFRQGSPSSSSVSGSCNSTLPGTNSSQFQTPKGRELAVFLFKYKI